ncbi:kinase, catalytic domain [Fusarium agapanthi]|uniref:Kinase, catalytic domain n=1 Tax=Fusarium agapanthi TaxID=1803897 RepID=A0A9P5BBA6_9HYPO|nr:kinase, catalytic domain [Fusarium agapanthi]
MGAAVRLRRIVLEAKDRETESLVTGQTSHYLGQLDDYLGLDAAAFNTSISTLTADLPRTAVVNGRDALLEWKLYKTDAPDNMSQRQYEWVVRSSMRSLAKLLSQTPKPVGLRALNCLGFYEPSARGLGSPVCFAFSPPPLTYREPVSLAKFIEMDKERGDLGGVSVDSHMFLGDRFALATTLARAVQQLHNLGWLHKGIRSQNILFYRPNDVRDIWRPEPRDLYLVGYEFARPASQASLSIPVENESGVTVYHHPLYVDSQSVGYEPRFDLYSLGIVLIEIACGKTATQMAQRGRVDISAPWEWDLYIAHYLLSEVDRRMGKVYGEVVRRCIKGDIRNDQAGQNSNYQTYLRSLDVDIVGRLELCYA